MRTPTYVLFIDESGNGNLNHGGKYFVLGCVIIHKVDYDIIEGYLRLLKRKYLYDDMRIIHTTDMFERPWQKYRMLLSPKRVILKFIRDLKITLANIPYNVALYYVDKDKLRGKLKYTPAKGRKNSKNNPDLPYEMCAKEAIKDFTEFLISKRAIGEIVIESRLNQDSDFVSYFDQARQDQMPKNKINTLARETRKRVNSILIANKRIVNGGLEIADICSFVSYRKLTGDPMKQLKVDPKYLGQLGFAIEEHFYLKNKAGRRIKLKELK